MTDNISYQPAEEVLCQKVGNEAVLLDMRSGRYFGLTSVASQVWDLINAGQTIGSAAEIIAAEYGEPGTTVLRDVSAFIESMTSRGLLNARA